MSQAVLSNHVPEKRPLKTSGRLFFRLILATFILTGVAVNYFVFATEGNLYGLSNALWHLDCRFWPPWLSGVFLLFPAWCFARMILSLFIPENNDKIIFLRRVFYTNMATIVFVFIAIFIWHCYGTKTWEQLYMDLLGKHYSRVFDSFVLPLADASVTGKRTWATTLPFYGVYGLLLLYLGWKILQFAYWIAEEDKRFKEKLILVICTLPFLTQNPLYAEPLQNKGETAVGKFDVVSAEQLQDFTAEDVVELVQMENDRVRGNRTKPHPILDHVFQEKTFHYTGGRYENSEFKYRLRCPDRIVPNKRYPLVVHLHGIGETGTDNLMSLCHLHSILPLIIGPDREDFFILVMQCPEDNKTWSFSDNKDGNLDVLTAMLQEVERENPIDPARIGVFGISSGGYGVWELILRHPEKFAAAVPTACTVPHLSKQFESLKNMSIWTFRNKGDGSVPREPILKVAEALNEIGGYCKFTEIEAGGHHAWWGAIEDYDCFRWLIAQKKRAWLNPPPEREHFQMHDEAWCFRAFGIPLFLGIGLLVFQNTGYFGRIRRTIHSRFYPYLAEKWFRQEEWDEEEEDDIDLDVFRLWTDSTGKKTIELKFLGFQDGKARFISRNGKSFTAGIDCFCPEDKMLLQAEAEEATA